MKNEILGSYEITKNGLGSIGELNETREYLKHSFNVELEAFKYAEKKFYAMLILDFILTDDAEGVTPILQSYWSGRGPGQKDNEYVGPVVTITEESYEKLNGTIMCKEYSLAELINYAISDKIIERCWSINQDPTNEDEANESANALMNRLTEKLGGVWDSEIWFNDVWHFKATKGSISVTQAGRTGSQWLSLVNDVKGDAKGGAIHLSMGDKTFSTPEGAARAGLDNMANYVRNITATLKDNIAGTKLTYTI